MKLSEVISLLNETNFSPEKITEYISISNSTYRRWLKSDPKSKIPEEYEQNVADGIYKLLIDGFLSYDSTLVNNFLNNHLPKFFQASIGQLNYSEDLFSKDANHQDKIIAILAHLGNSSKVRDRIDNSGDKIKKFLKWGNVWKSNIQFLLDIIKLKSISSLDKLVAYGSLFYLILPFDLIPDQIAVFGYVDDFGIIGFATEYYRKKTPKLDT